MGGVLPALHLLIVYYVAYFRQIHHKILGIRVDVTFILAENTKCSHEPEYRSSSTLIHTHLLTHTYSSNLFIYVTQLQVQYRLTNRIAHYVCCKYVLNFYNYQG